MVELIKGLRHAAGEGLDMVVEAGAVVRFGDGLVVEAVEWYRLARLNDLDEVVEGRWVRDDLSPRGRTCRVQVLPPRRVVALPVGALVGVETLRRVAEERI